MHSQRDALDLPEKLPKARRWPRALDAAWQCQVLWGNFNALRSPSKIEAKLRDFCLPLPLASDWAWLFPRGWSFVEYRSETLCSPRPFFHFSCSVSGSTRSRPATSHHPVPGGVARKLSAAADAELLPAAAAAAAAAGLELAPTTAADSAGRLAAEDRGSGGGGSGTAAPGAPPHSPAGTRGAGGKSRPGLGVPEESPSRRAQRAGPATGRGPCVRERRLPQACG